MTTIRAVVFDVDGTLAETEELHRLAFNATFAEQGLNWHWDRHLYTELLATTGGRERIEAYVKKVGQPVATAALHKRKTEFYGEMLAQGSINLRPGVVELISNARQKGLRLAIGTTTSRCNVLSLLDATIGLQALELFDSVRTGEDVRAKKPDPEVYKLVLSDLGLTGSQCLCIEDSRPGLLAARAAGMHVLVTPSLYTGNEDFNGAGLILRNLAMPWSSPEFSPYTSLMDQPLDVVRLLTGDQARPDKVGSIGHGINDNRKG